MDVRKPIWTSSSFLLYTGGFIVLFSAAGSLAYLGTQYGQAALVAWTLLPLGVLLALALGFQRRGWWIAAGVFAFATVSIWGTFWGEVFDWWGWTPGSSSGPFDGFNWSIWLLALLVLFAALAALRRFRFPLLIIFVIEAIYYIVTDFISSGASGRVLVMLASASSCTGLRLRFWAFWRGRCRPCGAPSRRGWTQSPISLRLRHGQPEVRIPLHHTAT